jgi:DNA-directed RNA polymerase specialized sigma24 family protein
MTRPRAAASIISSFNALVEEHSRLIDAILRSYLPARLHDDARQEFLARLWTRYPGLLAELQAALATGQPAPHYWRPYIQTALKHVAFDFVNFERDNCSRDDPLHLPRAASLPGALEDSETLAVEDCVPDPASFDPTLDGAVAADLALVVSRALKKLSPEERDAAIARLEEWRDTEHAERRGLSVSTARRRRLTAQEVLVDAVTTAGHSPITACRPDPTEGSASS